MKEIKKKIQSHISNILLAINKCSHSGRFSLIGLLSSNYKHSDILHSHYLPAIKENSSYNTSVTIPEKQKCRPVVKYLSRMVTIDIYKTDSIQMMHLSQPSHNVVFHLSSGSPRWCTRSQQSGQPLLQRRLLPLALARSSSHQRQILPEPSGSWRPCYGRCDAPAKWELQKQYNNMKKILFTMHF